MHQSQIKQFNIKKLNSQKELKMYLFNHQKNH